MRKTAGEYIPVGPFASTLKEVKAQRGLSWAELAAECGRTRGTITSYVYGNRTVVTKETAEDILRRLAGEHLPPTSHQTREYTVAARKTQTDQRSETLQSKKLDKRKAAIAELRESLRQVRVD